GDITVIIEHLKSIAPRKRALLTVALATLAATAALMLLSSCSGSKAADQAAATTAATTPAATAHETVFVPRSVPMSQRELANPFRGQYVWEGAPVQPRSWRALDSYRRYSWRELEPSRHRYDFGRIDRELAAARRRGGRFGFGVMPVCTDGCSA